MIAVAGVARSGILNVPIAQQLVHHVVALDTHEACFVAGSLPYTCSYEVVVAPLAGIGKVVGALQCQYLGVAVGHRCRTHHILRAHGVGLIVVIIDSIGCGEGKTLCNVKLQVDMSVHHGAVTVVLILVNQAPWIFLDTVEGVVVVSAVSVTNIHSRREV